MHESDGGCDQQKHIYLQWLNQRRHFSLAKRWVHHCLTGTVGTGLIVGRAGIKLALVSAGGSGLKRSKRAALRAADARNLAAFGQRSDYVSALFLTFDAEFLHALAHDERRLLCTFLNG